MSNSQLNDDEISAVINRVQKLMDTEKQIPGLVLERCNGTNKSNRKYFRKVFSGDKGKTDRCISYLEKHGGFCNCEILYNVYPFLVKTGILPKMEDAGAHEPQAASKEEECEDKKLPHIAKCF